jgi:hypothetical protein
VRRALLFWVTVRVVLFVFALALRHEPQLPPPAVLLLAAVVAAMCILDARFMREDIFYANLGVPRWAPAAYGLIVPLAGEVMIAVAVRIVT